MVSSIARFEGSVKINDMSYRVEIEKSEEGGYVGQFISPPSFRGAVAQAETLEECKTNLEETIKMMSPFIHGYRIK